MLSATHTEAIKPYANEILTGQLADILNIITKKN